MRFGAYGRFFRNAARTRLTHRLNVVLGSLGATVQLTAMATLWGALLVHGARLGGFSLAEMKTYLVVGYITGVLGGAAGEHVMAQRVRTGAIALDLVRPVNDTMARFAETLGGLAVALPPALLVSTVFVLAAGPVAPVAAPGLFLCSLAAVPPVTFLILRLSTLAGFWTQNYHGLAWARTAIALVLSGGMVPLSLLPSWLGTTAAWLPFAATASTPALIAVGAVSGSAALGLIGAQWLWVAILWLASALLWRVAIRHLTVHGG